MVLTLINQLGLCFAKYCALPNLDSTPPSLPLQSFLTYQKIAIISSPKISLPKLSFPKSPLAIIPPEYKHVDCQGKLFLFFLRLLLLWSHYFQGVATFRFANMKPSWSYFSATFLALLLFGTLEYLL